MGKHQKCLSDTPNIHAAYTTSYVVFSKFYWIVRSELKEQVNALLQTKNAIAEQPRKPIAMK